MPNVAVVDMAGNKVSEITLSDAIFAIEPNAAVMHQMVVNYLANQRQGTQSALTRAEVSGGGKKPWRQKDTGHARQGSTRAPQWTHGGIGEKTRYEISLFVKVRGGRDNRSRFTDDRHIQDKGYRRYAQGGRL